MAEHAPLSSDTPARASLGFHLLVFILNIGLVSPPSCQNEAASRKGTTGEAMSTGATFRVEKVFIKDSVEGAVGDTMEAAGKSHVSTM